MQFEVKLLTKNISLVKLDELFLSSEIIGIISSDHGEVGDKNVAECSIDYKCSYENDEFTISIQQFRSGIVEISLSYEYSNYKLKAAKKFDKFLSKFREFLGKNHLKYSILSNSLSMYFLNRLYPKFQVYESLLRKIFVLALSPLEDEDIVRIIKEQTNDKLDLSKIHTIEHIERLQIAELHSLIFEININPVNNLTNHFKNFQDKSEYHLKQMIKKALPITIWEKHFAPFTDNERADVLKNSYNSIREYRNDVMHFHMLTYKRYKKIDSLLSDVIEELKEVQNNMLERWDFEATRKLTNDIIYSEFKFILKIKSKEIKSAIDSSFVKKFNFNNFTCNKFEFIKKEFDNIQIPKIDFGVLESIKGISDTFKNLNLPKPLNGSNSEDDEE